jgi:hypothetical protein
MALLLGVEWCFGSEIEDQQDRTDGRRGGSSLGGELRTGLSTPYFNTFYPEASDGGKMRRPDLG